MKVSLFGNPKEEAENSPPMCSQKALGLIYVGSKSPKRVGIDLARRRATTSRMRAVKEIRK